METWQLGDGDPDVAVVAGIHGDEPSGPCALERIRADPPTVDEPILFVVANERALDREVRYVDEDLNRAFPGDPNAESHEGRLAAQLLDVLGDRLTLSLHATQSYPDPFAIVTDVDADDRFEPVCSRLPIDAVVEAGPFVSGRLLTAVPTIEVECGHQGSEAATDNATAVIDAFLRATGVRQGPDPPRSRPVYRLRRRIPKRDAEEYAVHVENLTRVDAGELYATAGEEEAIAENAFYPVLLSAYGYDDVFGYEADHVGTIGGDAVSAD